MASFAERYRGGEHERVWEELVALGGRVRNEPLRADARAVARETMRRARENVALLVTRLGALGYEFAYQPDPGRRTRCWWGDAYPVYEPPLSDAAARLDTTERELGPMPFSLRAWYEEVGTVNFIGGHANWPDTDVLDSLVVGPLAEMLVDIEDEYRRWREDAAAGFRGNTPFRWVVAPDALHKANISGGGPYGVEYPSAHADARLRDEWHQTTFVNYLRVVFRWGGFPGFARCAPADRPVDDLARLTEGLWPI